MDIKFYTCFCLTLQPVVRIYNIPDNTFETDEEEESSEEDDSEESESDGTYPDTFVGGGVGIETFSIVLINTSLVSLLTVSLHRYVLLAMDGFLPSV